MRVKHLIVVGLVWLGAGALPAVAQIHTSHDHIPDFCAAPTISSATNGRWDDASTWSPARVPSGNDAVRVSAGTAVQLDSQLGAPLRCVGIAGRLTFSPSANTRLWAGTVLVYDTGTLEIGTTSQPVQSNVTAELVIANQPLDLQSDPDQWGTALLGLGTVKMHGTPRTPTFSRVATEPRAGDRSLVLEAPVSGWQPGDRLILPDTRHLQWDEVSNWTVIAPQWEELTVQSVSSDGRTIALNSALQFDHLGARDAAGTLDFLPHTGNLSRNVIVRSEGPAGSGVTLGHVAMTQRATVDIRYALFKDLGRTTTALLDPVANHIGRYPLHMHHLIGPQATPANGYQFTLLGNAIDGGTSAATNQLKWGITVHNSHFGLVQDNVVYNWGGALVMFEDGQESYNVVEHNFAVRSFGTGGFPGDGGREGGGFWFRGPNNYVRRNVAANITSDAPDAAYGFKYYFVSLGNLNIPSFKGADNTVAGQFTTFDGNNTPILEFSDNEVYGATHSGLTYWWVSDYHSGATTPPYSSVSESVMRNFHVWHVFNKGIYHYPARAVTFDGLVVRGKNPDNSACCSMGFEGGDYEAIDITIRNSNIQGMRIGISPSLTQLQGLQTFENNYLRNVWDFQLQTLGSTNGTANVFPRHVVLRNNQHVAWPGHPLIAINMNWNPGTSGRQDDPTKLDETLVYGFQGNPSDNFRPYYPVQATQDVAGGFAPCAATRAEVGGIACPISGTSTGGPRPPAAPQGLRVTP